MVIGFEVGFWLGHFKTLSQFFFWDLKVYFQLCLEPLQEPKKLLMAEQILLVVEQLPDHHTKATTNDF